MILFLLLVSRSELLWYKLTSNVFRANLLGRELSADLYDGIAAW